ISTKSLFIIALSLAALTAGAWAENPGSGAPAGASAAAPAPTVVTAADVQALKDALAAQQLQIQRLTEQLERQQAWQLQQSGATAAAKTATTQSAPQQMAAVNTSVAVQPEAAAVSQPNPQETKAVNPEWENPVALHYKGITITPGGFLAAETVRRSRALGSDINTPFNALTMPGASQSSVSEFFGSGRQSRITMLAQGQAANFKLSGYYEADFLSAAVTSNNNESNSYALRQRQVWGQAAFNSGLSITGGQMWSLVTETKHGMDNRSEALPMTIDPQYTVGFSWARQYGLRLVKNFNNRTWVGVSMENAQATLSTHGNGDNFLVGSAGAASGLYNAAGAASAAGTASNIANYSFNPSPDVIAKIVYEAGVGHYELFGIYSRFRDRVFPCGEVAATATCAGQAVGVASGLLAYNSGKNGGGIGGNARWSVYDKHLDFGVHFLGGSGIGRYGTGGLPDTSVSSIGTLDLLRNSQGLATLEWHGPKADIYMNVGAEYASRASDFDPISGKYVGYGSPNFNNSGCYTETAPSVGSGFFPGALANCTADTRALIEGTFGIWFKPYDGSRDKVNRGRIQWGPQFSYVDREVWSGVGGEPHGLDAMLFTSFRYYLP
ncbi:MAG: hypothetical protein WBP98_18975, partial [Candidatus Sulfotelmatobacter sp.]